MLDMDGKYRPVHVLISYLYAPDKSCPHHNINMHAIHTSECQADMLHEDINTHNALDLGQTMVKGVKNR